MVSLDISVQPSYRDYEACEMAIPLAAETYGPTAGISVRLVCSDMYADEILKEIKHRVRVI